MTLSKSILFPIAAIVFLSVGIFYHSTFKSGFTESSVATEAGLNLRNLLNDIDGEAKKLTTANLESNAWVISPYAFYLIDSSNILAWSKNSFLPHSSLLQGPFLNRLIQNPNGDFLVRKWQLKPSRFLCCVVPLVERYKVSNRYLSPQWNASVFPIKGIDVRSIESREGTAVCLDGSDCLFKILLNPSFENLSTDWASMVFISLGIIFSLMSFYGLLRKLHQRKQFEIVFLLAFLFLYLVRMTMIYYGFPAQWGHFDLFDPQRFASSSFNVSLGDFLLNAAVVFVCCVYLFLNYSKFTSIKKIVATPAPSPLLIGTFSLTVALFSFLFPFLFYELVFHNSTIPLDITQRVHFDWLRLLAYVTVIVGAMSSFLFCHVFVKIAIRTAANQLFRFSLMMFGASLIFLLYCLVENHNYSISFSVGLIYFFCIYFSGWHRSLKKIGFATFLYLLLAIVAYSLQGALSIKTFAKEATRVSQFRFANNNLINHDNLGEYLLSENAKRISIDPFIQARLANPFLSKEAVRQRVKQAYFSSYFDRYEMGVYLYNSSGDPLDNQSTEGLASSIKSFKEAAIKTDYEGVYWISDQATKSIKRYVGIIPIQRNGSSSGFIVLDLSLKRIIPQNVYPELLVDSRFSQFIGNKDFSFAVFAQGIISSSFGAYNYDRDFDRNLLNNPLLYHEGIEENGVLHIGVEDEAGKRAIVTANLYPFFFVLANFAFLFVSGLGLVLTWVGTNTITSLWRGYKPNYSSRIQLYVYAAFILPLSIVTIATLSLTSNANEAQLKNDFELKARQIGERITALLEGATSDSVFSTTNLETELSELSRSTSTDINVYGAKGELMASSQPAIFESHLISTLISRQAWHSIVNDKETYSVKKEDIGLLQYNSSYLALKSPTTGQLLGVLNLPFFKSADAIESIQVTVLANILVIFVIVFILFTLISFYAVEWLTLPLRFIAKTLGKTTLTGENQPLQWKSNDEIGLMVNEYNRMLANLEQSKIELSRSQKESAWREMAQQVAHEIKNPLTPMKLTLQQMELSQHGDEKKRNSIKMLLEQVEILNDIASSFSTFAKMPTPQLTKLNVVNVLRNAVSLYANHSNGKVAWNGLDDTVFVFGDEQLLSRIFSNIILNGLQSAGEDGKITVEVALTIENNKCLIRFKDNGKGIEPAARERVFTPYFSTKKSGSGLGLAIAKQGIEQCGGKIGFVSEKGKGTEFWVELPVLI